MLTTRLVVPVIHLLLLASACATQSVQSEDAATPSSAAGARGVPDLISYAELTDPSMGDLDALSIIKRLRPAFLATRGGAGTSMSSRVTGIQVTIGGGPLQPLSALTSIHASEMLEIRYLNAPAAAQAYGSASGAAAVIIIKRK